MMIPTMTTTNAQLLIPQRRPHLHQHHAHPNLAFHFWLWLSNSNLGTEAITLPHAPQLKDGRQASPALAVQRAQARRVTSRALVTTTRPYFPISRCDDGSKSHLSQLAADEIPKRCQTTGTCNPTGGCLGLAHQPGAITVTAIWVGCRMQAIVLDQVCELQGNKADQLRNSPRRLSHLRHHEYHLPVEYGAAQPSR